MAGPVLAGGQAALADASSRPVSSRRRISESKALAIVEFRKRRLTPQVQNLESVSATPHRCATMNPPKNPPNSGVADNGSTCATY